MDLRTVAVAYHRAGIEYIKQWLGSGKAPEDDAVRAAQLALEGQLSVLAGLRLPGVKDCRRLLKGLRERQEPPWGSSGKWKQERTPQAKQNFSAQCFAKLDDEVDKVLDVARTAERLLPRPRIGWGGLRALAGGVRDRAVKVTTLGRKRT
jgi:hypothetical protein